MASWCIIKAYSMFYLLTKLQVGIKSRHLISFAIRQKWQVGVKSRHHHSCLPKMTKDVGELVPKAKINKKKNLKLFF